MDPVKIQPPASCVLSAGRARRDSTMSRPLGCIRALLALSLISLESLLPGLSAGTAESDAPSADAPAGPITTATEFWQLSSTSGDREFPLRAEIGVNYYDADWSVIWAEWDGAGCYLSAGDRPLPIRAGQRVRLEGFALPGRQQILWERTKITVIDEVFHPTPVPLPDPVLAPGDVNQRLVVAEGLVTEQTDADPTHARLVIVTAERSVTAYVHLKPEEAVPQWQGAFIRARGVFLVKYDATQSRPSFELWIVQAGDVQATSWLGSDPRFSHPRTTIEKLAETSPDQLVRIEGVVHAQEPGHTLTVRDETGQVLLLTRQTSLAGRGARVEAIGYPRMLGVESRLERALYRACAAQTSGSSTALALPLARLRLTEQIRQLDASETVRGYPVAIRGVVTWSNPAQRTFFLQDASGGVRVVIPSDANVPVPAFTADVTVTGSTQPGEFAPVVRAEQIGRGSGNTLPPAVPMTYEQAMTGARYGEWVQLMGYVRSVNAGAGDQTQVELTTPGGELITYVPHLAPDPGLVGALVSVDAVCDAVVNERGQLTGVRLWVPSAEFFRVQERAPSDIFSTPPQTIGSLLRFGSARQLNRRVQVSGVVALHRPGALLYLEDGEDRLLVLSRQQDALQPGDRVNVVGFPGHEGVRLIMRDAVYRKVGAGAPPIAHALPDVETPNAALEGETVRIRARLLDRSATAQATEFQLQQGRTLFEAHLSSRLERLPEVGSILELTGVYRVQFDEYRQPHTFVLDLRSPADLRIESRPPWWTTSRMLWAAGALLTAVLLSIAWAVLLSRKNRLLHRAERELHDINSELETRVADRTRDLKLEIVERRRSEEVLAEERRLLRTVIDNLPVYLYVKNATGRFVIGNLPHARLLGAESGFDVVGKSDYDIYPHELARCYEEDDQRVLQTGEPLILHEEPSNIGGRSGWFASTKVPLRDRHGQIVGLIGISQDITQRKQAEAEHEQLQQQLLESSRRAGMAEVATGILHNVGNVLNSVNVSANLAVERVRGSRVAHVARLAELLQQHAHDLPGFFTRDPRSAKVPEFLNSLAKELTAEQSGLLQELEHLWKKIEHIKDIVAMQQNYATVGGVAEMLDLTDLVEDALRMNASSLSRHDIEIVRDYQAKPALISERHKIVQILVNLIRNAKQACDASNQPNKQITLRLSEADGFAHLAVIDNGVGIPPENLTRIFAHGFTTRKEGHGFGLHSGSLAARELGGSLVAESAGPGQGASFTLNLPLSTTPESPA